MHPTQLQCRPNSHRPRAIAMRASSSNGNGAPPPPAPPPAAAQAAYAEVPGPQNAFVPGQESESRRQLFNRISPVYDEVSGSPVQPPGTRGQVPAPCNFTVPASTATLPVHPPQNMAAVNTSTAEAAARLGALPTCLHVPVLPLRARFPPLMFLFLQLNDRLSLGQAPAVPSPQLSRTLFPPPPVPVPVPVAAPPS